MLEEYSGRFYVPCVENSRRLGTDGFAKARELAQWRKRVKSLWPEVRIVCVEEGPQAAQPMGSTMPVRALVALGGLAPDEVLVEVYHGPVDDRGDIAAGDTTTMTAGEARPDGVVYEGAIPCTRAGRRGYTVRAVPRKEGFPLGRFETGLVAWWDDPERRPCDEHATAGKVKQRS
jgi:starch phosphorylase